MWYCSAARDSKNSPKKSQLGSLQRFAWPRLLDSGRARLREPTTLLARSCTYRANLTDHDTSGAVVYLSSQPYRSRQVSGHRRANRLSECTLGSHCRRRRGESVPHITLLRWDVAERMHPRSRRIPLESHRERRHSFDLSSILFRRARPLIRRQALSRCSAATTTLVLHATTEAEHKVEAVDSFWIL